MSLLACSVSSFEGGGLDDSSEQEEQQPEVHCVVCLVCVLVPSLVGARCREGDDFDDETEMIDTERRRNVCAFRAKMAPEKGHRQLAPLDKVLDNVVRDRHGKWRWGGQ
jgi:hypothetical protein